MEEQGKKILRVDNLELTTEDLKKQIQELGINKGDVLCVHSELFKLGKPLLHKESFLKEIVILLQELVGKEGTLIMPTFSYSFCKNELFDLKVSSSTVGILTEYFRTMENVKRTKHPIFSFAVWGKKQEEYLDIGPDAFSLDSVYGKMIYDDGKILMLGANKGYTFYYLAEEHMNVSHRYFKIFDGQVKDELGQVYDTKVPYFVRDLSIKSDVDEEKLARFLLDNGYQKQKDFAKGMIGVFECKKVYSALNKELRKDNKIFL